MYKGISNT